MNDLARLHAIAPRAVPLIDAACLAAVDNPPDSWGTAASEIAFAAVDLYPGLDSRELFWLARAVAVAGVRTAREERARLDREARASRPVRINLISQLDSSWF